MEAKSQLFTAQAALCLVGCLQLITFASILLQSPLLYGQHGLQPISAYLTNAAKELLPAGASYTQHVWTMMASNPTLLWLHAALGLQAEAMFTLVCVIGAALSAAAACGVLHPLVFAALWGLYLSVAGVGQAFLQQPGDTLLLELTFACIWLSPCLTPKLRPAAAGDGQQQQPQQKDTHPAALLMKWLLFKVLLLSSSIKATVVCPAVPGLAACFRALSAHGPPHTLTWLAQALPSPLAALLAAVALLELPAAFLVLCPSKAVQRPAAAGLLLVQLARVVLGNAGLANLAAAVLTVGLLDDGVLVPLLQRVGQALATRGLLQPGEAAAASAPQGAAGSAELMAYKTGSRHHRSLSADSLGSLLSDPDLTLQAGPTREPFSAAGLLKSRKAQSYAAAAAVIAGGMFSYSSGRGLILRLSPQQLTTVLSLLVPAASLWWLFYMASAAFVTCQQALESARQAAAALAAKLATRRAAAAAAAEKVAVAANARQPAAAAACDAPKANGVISPPLSPVAAPQAAVAEAPAGSLTPEKAAAEAAEAGADATGDAAKPARRGRAKAATAGQAPSGTPTRRAGRGKTASAALAAALAEEEQENSDATHAPAAIHAKGKKGGSRASKAAAAAAVAEEDEPESGAATKHRDGAAAAEAAASQAGETDAAVARNPVHKQPAAKAAAAATTPAPAAPNATPAPATTSTPAAGSTARSGTASCTAALSMADWRLLQEQAQPWLPAVWALMVAGAVLALAVAGLPAVLVPAGFTQTTLSAVPGLLPSYRWARNFGMVSGSSASLADWQATMAAAQQLPGSYLAFQFSVASGEGGWSPVRFKQGLGSTGLGGAGGSWLEALGVIRGPYEPRLQGMLAAAGRGSVADNMWLLHVADMLLEGSPALGPALQQPLAAHDWVKVDLVRYAPSSLVAAGSSSDLSASSWQVDQVQEVLPALPRGDPDLKEALAAFGWGQQPAHRSAGGISAPPALVLGVLMAAVVAWHVWARDGLVRRAIAL